MVKAADQLIMFSKNAQFSLMPEALCLYFYFVDEKGSG